MSLDSLNTRYKNLPSHERKTVRHLALGLVALGLALGLVVAAFIPSADAATPRLKSVDRLGTASTNAGASLLEPIYACEVLDDIEGRVANVSLPGRPQVGDTINDQSQRERTIRSVKVRWSEGRPATQYQPATIKCVVVLAPPVS